MNCTEMQSLLSEYLDGELSGELQARATQHLEACTSCSRELAGFSDLSGLAKSLPDPKLPDEIWDRLQRDLVEEHRVEIASAQDHGAWSTYRVLAVAASLLIAVGIVAWLAGPFGQRHHHVAAHFGRFMEDFPTDPDRAQQVLMANYDGRLADPDELSRVLRYTPVALKSPPSGYALHQSYLLEMPCCRCSQVVFQDGQGGFVTVFEHDTTEQLDWFGDCPCIETEYNGNPCTLAQMGNHLAASCEVRGRHFTIAGARDVEEVETFIAWLEEVGQPDTARS